MEHIGKTPFSKEKTWKNTCFLGDEVDGINSHGCFPGNLSIDLPNSWLVISVLLMVGGLHFGHIPK